MVTQVKVPHTFSFLPLDKACKEPEFLMADFAKFDAPPKMHLCFFTLHEYVKKEGRMPAPWSQADAEAFVETAKHVTLVSGGAEPDLDVDYLKQFAKVCAGDLSPMNAAIGKSR